MLMILVYQHLNLSTTILKNMHKKNQDQPSTQFMGRNAIWGISGTFY